MTPVDLRTYMARAAAWQRQPAETRRVVETRDALGRPCRELWAGGKCYVRRVDVGQGYCVLYADRGNRQVPDQGKISFHTWDRLDAIYGDGKPHGMPMVPRS